MNYACFQSDKWPQHPGLRLVMVVILFWASLSSPLFAQLNYATPYTISTLAGSADAGGGFADGAAEDAQFNYPCGVAVDNSGNVYVADTENQRIRKISTDGNVATMAGNGSAIGGVDGKGSTATFNDPRGVAVDGSGNVYVADTDNDTIRKITPGGEVTTLAGSAGHAGRSDGSANVARFYGPYGIAVDHSGTVYLADTSNDTIRKITSTGVVSTLAGNAGSAGSNDGSGSGALFYNPQGVAVDGSGNVYVADTGNNVVRKIAPSGVVTTLAGYAYVGETTPTDGAGSSARFYGVDGVAVDAVGNIYVVDEQNFLIRKVTPAGVVTTLAGAPFPANPGSGDGIGSVARFNYPQGIAADGNGDIYVADTQNYTIRAGTPPADLLGGTVTGNLKVSPWFGYYSYGSYPLVYEYSLGFEYVFDAGNGGIFLYDYASGHFWYTQSSYFPFVYDFSLNAFLYYYNASTPHRHFYSYGTNTVITE